MTAERSSDVQRAIDFLSGPKLREMRLDTLPARPDYEVLAQRARELGHDLSPDTVREAFRLMMCVRLAAASGQLSTGGTTPDRAPFARRTGTNKSAK